MNRDILLKNHHLMYKTDSEAKETLDNFHLVLCVTVSVFVVLAARLPLFFTQNSSLLIHNSSILMNNSTEFIDFNK